MNPYFNQPSGPLPTSSHPDLRSARGTWEGNPITCDLDDLAQVVEMQQQYSVASIIEVQRRDQSTMSHSARLDHLHKMSQDRERADLYRKLHEERLQDERLPSILRDEIEDSVLDISYEHLYEDTQEQLEREKERTEIEALEREKRRKKAQEEQDNNSYEERHRERERQQIERERQRIQIQTERCDRIREQQEVSGGEERAQRIKRNKKRKERQDEGDHDTQEIDNDIDVEIESEENCETRKDQSVQRIKVLQGQILQFNEEIHCLRGRARKNKKSKRYKLQKTLQALLKIVQY